MNPLESPWSELRSRVTKSVSRSREFRKLLLADPRSAIETNWDLKLPDGLEVRVLQESPGTRFLVLPPAGGELTDDQLETVAGGFAPSDGLRFGDSDGSGGDRSDGDYFP